MAVFFIIVGLVVAIIVLSIKYFKTYAKVASHDAYDSAAKKKAERLKREDPIISCDYCGAKINTRIQKTCPQCGAAYDLDDEWLKRHNPDAEWIEINSIETAGEEVRQAQARAKKLAKYIRIIIYILIGMLLFMVGTSLIINFVENHTHGKYIKDEKLNQYSYEKYEPVEYDFEGDPVVFEEAGARVTADGIYRDEEYNYIKIGYKIENLTKEPLEISFSRSFLNRVESRDIDGGWVEGQSSVMVYSWIYDNVPEAVKSITLTGFRVYGVGNEKLYNGGDADCTILTTNADFDETPVTADENIVFENDKVTVAQTDDYSFWVYNKTDCAVFMTGSEYILINNNKYEATGIYKEMIPAGCVHTRGRVRCFDEAFTELKEDDCVQFSISFHSDEDPTIDFSTGYFELIH